jgi:hypothetical protein
MKYLLYVIPVICTAFVAAYFCSVRFLNNAKKMKVDNDLAYLGFFIKYSLTDHVSRKHILASIDYFRSKKEYRGSRLTELTNLYIEKFELVDENSPEQIDFSECEKRIKLQNEASEIN